MSNTHVVEIVVTDSAGKVIARRKNMPYPSAIAYLNHWQVNERNAREGCECSIREVGHRSLAIS